MHRMAVEAGDTDAFAVLETDPVASCWLRPRFAADDPATTRLVVTDLDAAAPVAVACVGRGLVDVFGAPGAADPAAVRSLASAVVEACRPRGEAPVSIVGPRAWVDGGWPTWRGRWSGRWDVRDGQELLRLDVPSGCWADGLRRFTIDDLPSVFPACQSLYVEELGSTPYGDRPGVGFHAVVEQWLAEGRSWGIHQNGTVVFKAEVASADEHAVHLQGIWVHPGWRGRGLGTAATGALADLLATPDTPDGAGPRRAVTVVVNGYNERALRMYRRIGFELHAPWATLLRP